MAHADSPRRPPPRRSQNGWAYPDQGMLLAILSLAAMVVSWLLQCAVLGNIAPHEGAPLMGGKMDLGKLAR